MAKPSAVISQFNVDSYPEITEQPQYFKKEALQSQEMTFGELQRYIRDLRQSGFDTMHLSVQLNVKLAYPLVTLVMAVLAIPFALSMGKRGSLDRHRRRHRRGDRLLGGERHVSTPWATSTFCPRCWRPGRPTCSSAWPALICCCARPPDLRGLE